jgi:hypothetical protein
MIVWFRFLKSNLLLHSASFLLKIESESDYTPDFGIHFLLAI